MAGFLIKKSKKATPKIEPTKRNLDCVIETRRTRPDNQIMSKNLKSVNNMQIS